MWKPNRNLASILKDRASKLMKFDWTKKRMTTTYTTTTRTISDLGSSTNMVVPKNEVIRFISDCLCKVGTTPEDGYIVGHHLMTSDYCGHFSHGMNRMQAYVLSIKNGITNPSAKPKVVNDFQVHESNWWGIVQRLTRYSCFLCTSFFVIFVEIERNSNSWRGLNSFVLNSTGDKKQLWEKMNSCVWKMVTLRRCNFKCKF